MTTLADVIKPYVDGLQQVENFTQSTINDFKTYDKTLDDHKTLLVGSFYVGFSGMGAQAFGNAVNLNLLRSQQLQNKLYDVWEPSNHTRLSIQSLTSNSDTDLQIPNVNATTTPQTDLGYYALTPLDVQLRLRDESLRGLTVNQVLDLNSDAFKGNLANAVNEIKAEILKKHQQTLDVYKQAPDQTAVQDQVSIENLDFGSANAGVDQIAKYVSDTYETWRASLQNFTAGYIGNVTSVATHLDTVTTGDILHQLTQSGAAMMIQQTSDGGVVVALNNSDKLTPQQVEAAIQQYIQANGLKPPVHVTIIGLQKGADVGMQVGADVAANPNKYNFQVNNEVLVAPTNADAVDVTQQPNTEYDVYSFSRDLSDSGGWGPLFTPDAFGLATNFVTGVSASNAVGAVAGYITGVGENLNNRQNNAYLTQLQGMDPQHYYSVNTKSEDYIHLLPDEPGAHDPSILSSSNYAQSTYLNTVAVPDPVTTSQNIPNSNVTRTPTTSTDIAQLSAPTYYTF